MTRTARWIVIGAAGLTALVIGELLTFMEHLDLLVGMGFFALAASLFANSYRSPARMRPEELTGRAAGGPAPGPTAEQGPEQAPDPNLTSSPDAAPARSV